MLLTLSQLLDKDKLVNIKKILANANFKDGKLSAGLHAQRVKKNEELDQNSQQANYLDELVVRALAEREEFRNAVLPHRVSQPFFARYTKGMAYGDHIDDPIMGNVGERFRCDIAVTVFLNEPDDYEGGQLTINTTFGEQGIKLPAGDAVLYPASSLHRVQPVTKGERLVAVLWIQSLVREPAKRELLYELNQARETLIKEAPDNKNTALVDRSYTNLVRMWSEV